MLKGTVFFLLVATVFLIALLADQPPEILSREADFNAEWEFALLDSIGHKSTDEELAWRSVTLPHDWSIEASFDSAYEGATGYLPGGTGWYRKKFDSPESTETKTYLYFDGVYNNAEVWLNGKKLGFHPYGYSPFYYVITPYLHQDNSRNLLEVKVDRTRYADSRWYTGSGIYRDVKLITVPKLHIPVWGTYLTTPKITSEEATVHLEVKVKNAESESQSFTVQTVLYKRDGNKVAERSDEFRVASGEEQEFSQELAVTDPQLWDIQNTQQYRSVTSILQEGNEVYLDDSHVFFLLFSFSPSQ